MTGEILDAIEELYSKELQNKTSWGKNDVLSLYRGCVLKVLKDDLDKREKEKQLREMY